jgi:hypothetical protein
LDLPPSMPAFQASSPLQPPQVNVATILRSSLHATLGPRLSIAAVTELHVRTSELSSLELIDTSDF